MRTELCICAEIPKLNLATRLLIIMHWRENWSTTNTGRLAQLALPNSEIRFRGWKDHPLDLSDVFETAGSKVFLFPAEHSRILSPEFVKTLPKPITLIVPDGTWRQAAKTGRREAHLQRATSVMLPPGPKSRYYLRVQPQPGFVSTLEAVARAMGILEGPPIQKALEELHDLMVGRTVLSRSPDCEAWERYREDHFEPAVH